MPSIIQSKMEYRTGEVPVYVAYIYRIVNGVRQAIKREDVEFMTITHAERRRVTRNGSLVTVWEPVEFPGGIVNNVNISTQSVYDEPIAIADTNVLDKTGVTFPGTEYNFLYIPLRGRHYYPNHGQYRTTFRLELSNGETDLMVFESEADKTLERRIDRRDNNGIRYGNSIVFAGEIYAKYKEPEYLPKDSPDEPNIINPERGKLIFPSTTGLGNPAHVYDISEQINDIYMTVSNTATSQRLINRISIYDEIEFSVSNPTSTDVPFVDSGINTFPYNFNYIFRSNRLPTEGRYKFRFEIEAKRKYLTEGEENILCTFDIDVLIT